MKIKHLFFWLVMICCVAVFYSHYTQVIDDGLRKTFLPHSGHVNDDDSVEFSKAADGHFYIQAKVNNQKVIFLLDTGATDVILSKHDALAAGIDISRLRQYKSYTTANGQIQAGITKINKIEIGNFTITNIPVSVNTGSLSNSLLGMSALKYFNFTIRDDTITLYPKQ